MPQLDLVVYISELYTFGIFWFLFFGGVLLFLFAFSLSVFLLRDYTTEFQTVVFVRQGEVSFFEFCKRANYDRLFMIYKTILDRLKLQSF